VVFETRSFQVYDNEFDRLGWQLVNPGIESFTVDANVSPHPDYPLGNLTVSHGFFACRGWLNHLQLIIHFHPLGTNNLTVMSVAGRVFQQIAAAFIEVIQRHCVLIAFKAIGGGEVFGVAGGVRDADFVDDAVEEVFLTRQFRSSTDLKT